MLDTSDMTVIMIIWLVIFIVLIAIEALTLNLTTVWFAIGSAAAYLCALAGLSFSVQFIIFVIISLILLFFTKPVAQRYVNKHFIKTNVDSLVGQIAKTTTRINNREGFGTAILNGMEWSAISEDDDVIIEAGTNVLVKGVSGVKLIVTEMQYQQKSN